MSKHFVEVSGPSSMPTCDLYYDGSAHDQRYFRAPDTGYNKREELEEAERHKLW